MIPTVTVVSKIFGQKWCVLKNLLVCESIGFVISKINWNPPTQPTISLIQSAYSALNFNISENFLGSPKP